MEQTRVAYFVKEVSTPKSSQVQVPMLNEPYEWHSLLFRDQVILIL